MFSCRRFSHNIFIIHFCEVGVDLPAKPLSFVGPRQHGPDFLCLPAPLLAPCSPQSLCPSPSHANTARILPAYRRPCWRLVPHKPLFLRRATPTRPGFTRSVGALVGALFPAKPLSFVGSRQHGPDSPGFPAPLLAPCSPQSLCPSPSHANTARILPGPSVPLLAPCSPQSLCPSQSHANMARILPACRRPCCYNFREKRRSKKVVPRTTFLLLHLLWSG